MTVTLKLQVADWPPASVAVQVTVVIPIGNVLPVGGLQMTATGRQPPLAEPVKFTTAPAALVAVAVRSDEPVSTIGGRGLTVTVKLPVAVWPHASVAVQVTVVVPSGNVLPLDGLQFIVTGAHPPLAELVSFTTAPAALVAVTVGFDEPVRTIGGLLVSEPRLIPPGAVVEGDQVCPPSRLTSVKMSKKLWTGHPSNGSEPGPKKFAPRDGRLGLSRIIIPSGSPVRSNASLSVS